MNPTCCEIAPYLSKPVMPPKRVNFRGEEEFQYPLFKAQLEMLIGCTGGQIVNFDPFLVQRGRITRFNMHFDSPASKRKRVTHVKWFEPFTEGENSNKFIAVFEDGTIHVYFKESNHTIDRNREKVYYKSKPFQPGFPEEQRESTREKVLCWMQEHIETFDFEKFYPREFLNGKVLYTVPEPGQNPTLIKEDDRIVRDCISSSYRVYSHRALNLIFAFYKFGEKDINPNMMLRFDVRTINDIVTFRMGSEKREHWMVAACGDGYLRVVNMSKLIMLKAVKGMAGNPICIDIAKNEGAGTNSGQGSETRDLIAVGFDDDSFVVYSMI
jgi:hypothetical protein